MRVCPKCGHMDSPHWHRHKWRIDVDICHVRDFLDQNPILAQQLIDNVHSVVFDEYNAYKIGGKGRDHVFRVWMGLYKAVGVKAFHGMPAENVNHYGHMNPYQRRLDEVKVNL